jgi:RNA polymerase sigma factor (sigma-70 family)
MIDELIKQYYGDIFKWSFAKTKKRSDAEDLTQEIILQIIKSFSKNIIIEDKEKYIWKIAYFTWCNRAKEYSFENNIIFNETILNNQKDNTIDIEKTIEFYEIKETLNIIIDSFKNIMKECVRLYYFEDLSVKEVGLRLSIKESLVKYYLFEARNIIRRKLNDKD